MFEHFENAENYAYLVGKFGTADYEWRAAKHSGKKKQGGGETSPLSSRGGGGNSKLLTRRARPQER